jgi:hypothetical protein
LKLQFEHCPLLTKPSRRHVRCVEKPRNPHDWVAIVTVPMGHGSPQFATNVQLTEF